MKKYLYLITLCLLSGCSLFGSEEEEKPKEPTVISLSMYTDDSVNPNLEGMSSPVELQLFELSDDSMLLSSDYDQIKEDYEDALKNNFVEAYDYVLTPEKFKFVEAIELDEDTNYIGVVAHFSDPENSSWKKTVKVESVGKKYNIFIHIKGYELSLEKVE